MTVAATKSRASVPVDANGEVDPDFVPSNEAELLICLSSWEWRIFSGRLYKIMIKSDDDDDEGFVAPFRPNEAQTDFLRNLHYRNVILKARQLGFTTLIVILWLDHALFNANQRCAIIAQSKILAEGLFRDKAKFAYDNLPDAIRQRMPLKKSNAEEMLFDHNNSAMRVAVSARSGTTHRLHISEMGKISATDRKKSSEIIKGSLPSVPDDGIAVIESTAEGQSGDFYNIASKAQANSERGIALNKKQYRFHFYPWFKEPGYRMDPSDIQISPKEHQYFDKVEVLMAATIDLWQRAWYITQRDTEFSGEAETMWQEYPSTPDECWQKSLEGTYYATQLAKCRADGRICDVPLVRHVAVNTFWDIGASDGTGIWFHQQIGQEDNFIRYIEGWDETYDFFVKQMVEFDYMFGTHYLPHDANSKRQMGRVVASPLDMLEEIAPRHWKFEIVPRVETLTHGIALTRKKFGTARFDQTRCKEGIEHLTQYKKKWIQAQARWDSTAHSKTGGHTEAADSFRQWSQGYNGAPTPPQKRNQRRGTGMAA